MTSIASHAPLPVDRTACGVATIWLEAPHQPVVVLDSILLDRLEQSLAAIEADLPDVLLVRSRDERVWVAGADLKEINALEDTDLLAYMARGQEVLGRLADLPCTTIALVHGAALGGGLELAMHCNGIIVSGLSGRGKPYPVGLPETGLGLLPAWGGTQLLPARIGPAAGVMAIASGTPFMSNDLPEGLADRTVDVPGELEHAARELAGALSHPIADLSSCDAREMHAVIERVLADPETSAAGRRATACIATGCELGRAAGLSSEREGIVALRRTDETSELLRAFLDGRG